ncbi:MAG: hypothetical protein RL318_29 [Fibrobacterota bacterium]|jgi:uncharacterized protein (TIGR02145 family)
MSLVTRSAVAAGLLAATVPQAQLVVSHQSATGSSNSNLIRPYLKIENQGSETVDLAKTTLDYLINDDAAPTALVADCWYNSAGSCSDVTAEISNIPAQKEGVRQANVRVRLGFLRGQLAAGQSVILQWGLHEQSWQHIFNEQDDWSFVSTNGQWTVDTYVPVGQPGKEPSAPALVWKGLTDQLPDIASYKVGDVVRDRNTGSTYVLNDGIWQLLAESGKDGAVGPIGPQGPVGATGAAGQDGSVGPQGPKGDVGATGPAGKDGAVGAIGPQGPVGATGAAGQDGAIGPVGPQGSIGATGAAGQDGAIGPVGPQGPIGATGAAGKDGAVGAQGPKGEIGLTGAAGKDGAVGPQGPKGDIGLTGAAGKDGAVGPQGPKGDIGLTGAAGKDGAVGATGAQGPIGLTGPAGKDGAVGAIGPQGAKGAVGATGPQGIAGATGTAGKDGAVGAIGAQGPAGVPGVAGPAGPQGPKGDIGATGPQGPAGVPGVAGPVGPQGAKGDVGPAGPTANVTALQAQVTALQAQLAAVASGNFVYDSRDGKVYKTVVIGTQTWMAENLNYAGSGTCYGGDAANCAAYGRLYTWAEVMGVASTYNTTRLNPTPPSKGICPTGWHVPVNSEWYTLNSATGFDAAALKSTSGWQVNGNNSSGFNLLAGGFSGGYQGDMALLWGASEYSDNGVYRIALRSSWSSLESGGGVVGKTAGMSLRCVKN